MAYADTTSIIKPVSGLVKLMAELFQALSQGDNPPFDLAECVQSVETEFYHYKCCGEEDTGWGCAYRALQTVISGIVASRMENSLKRDSGDATEDDIVRKLDGIKLTDTLSLPEQIPSIKEIQNFLGITNLKQWIDPDYANTYLSKYGVKGRVEEVWGDEENELDLLIAKILLHFKNEALPIMIDDAIYAYTLVGYAKIIAKPDTFFTQTHYVLVLDPHVTNSYTHKDYKNIIQNQHETFFLTNQHELKLQVAGLKYEGGVFGTDGVFWLPFDVMFSKGAHKHWKVYFPSK